MSIPYRLTGLFLGVLLLAGCAKARHDLAEAGRYSLQIEPGTVSVVTTATVFREQETLVVAGKVKKLHEFHLPGKVHVLIYDPSGEFFAEAEPTITNYASKKGGMKTALFSTRFSQIPPEGSIIRLQYLDATYQK